MRPKFPYDLTTIKFGRLTVISLIEYKNHHTMWLCKCDCGKEKIVSRPNLISKGTSSCGCIKKEQNAKGRKEFGYGNFRLTFNQYKRAAFRRNIEFNLTEIEAKKLMLGNCKYCNIVPSTIVKSKNRYGEFIRNGIDRVDSTKGYNIENCVSCCDKCNWMKLDLSTDAFLKHIRRIHDNCFEWILS